MTKKLFLILLLPYFLISCNKEASRQVEFLSEREIDTLILKYGNEASKVFVEVSVQNRKYDFLFDTGAEVTYLDDSIPAPKNEKGSAHINDLRGKSFTVKKITVDTLLIGNIAFYHLKSCVKGSLNSMDGILGGNIIEKCAWKFDFAARKIYVAENVKAFGKSNNCIPLKLKNNRPYVQGKINNIAIEFLLDFGFSGFAHVSNEYLDATKLNNISTEAWYGEDLVVGFDSSQAFHLDTSFYSIGKLTIGNQFLENELITSYNFQKTNLLGMDFFRRFSYVILDYPNQRLYLGEKQYKSTSYIEGMKRINTTGVLVTYDTLPRVRQVLFSLIENKNIKPSDTVVEINNVSFLNREPSFYKDTVYHLYDSIRQRSYDQEVLSEFRQTIDIFHYIQDTSYIKIKKGDSTQTIHLIRQYNYTKLPDTVQNYVVPSLFIYESGFQVESDSGSYYLFKTKKLPPHAFKLPCW